MNRFERLRAVFIGRKRQLNELQELAMKDRDPASHPAQYARAVWKYDRARKAWRKIRGWQ